MSTEPLSTEYWVPDFINRMLRQNLRVYLADDIDTKFAALRAENAFFRSELARLQELTAEARRENDATMFLNQELNAQINQLATELGELQQAYTEMEACKREFRERAQALEASLRAAFGKDKSYDGPCDDVLIQTPVIARIEKALEAP